MLGVELDLVILSVGVLGMIDNMKHQEKEKKERYEERDNKSNSTDANAEKKVRTQKVRATGHGTVQRTTTAAVVTV